ncbi:MAG: hypothetical protein AAFU60_02905, partial [Bacteroidota bacterium]
WAADCRGCTVAGSKSATQVEQPVFLAHGSQDDRILPDYGKALYNHLKSKDKVWTLVDGGDHFDLWSAGGRSYLQVIANFLDRQLPKVPQQ